MYNINQTCAVMRRMGICTATGDENKAEAKMAEIKAYAAKL